MRHRVDLVISKLSTSPTTLLPLLTPACFQIAALLIQESLNQMRLIVNDLSKLTPEVLYIPSVVASPCTFDSMLKRKRSGDPWKDHGGMKGVVERLRRMPQTSASWLHRKPDGTVYWLFDEEVSSFHMGLRQSSSLGVADLTFFLQLLTPRLLSTCRVEKALGDVCKVGYWVNWSKMRLALI